MKKLMILCTMLFLVSCGKSAVEEASIVATDYEFTAYTPEEQSDSRTYVDAQMKLHWTKGDLVSIFHGMLEPLKFGFRGETGATSGTYYNVDGIFYAPDQSAPNNVAIYPYAADHLLDEDTRAVTLTMPAEQTYVEDSFGLGANTMIAITSDVNDLALYFKNVGTYLNVRLWGEQQTVKSITVMATGGEALSGKAIVTPTYGGDPTCVMADEAVSPSVKLVCEEVVTVDATEENPKSFWLVLPPVTMARGFTATIENADGDTQTFAIDRSITFARNKYNTLTRELAIEKQQVAPITTSTISYTTDDGNIVDLFTTEGFGAGYVSNIYDKENNIGTITFDGEITTIPAEAFLVCTNLTSVQIPNSVTTIAEKAFYGCNYMQKIIIPESVTQIKETAFEGCSGEAHIFCNINDKAFVGALFSKVVLDDCVTALGQECFMDCTELKEVVLSKGLTSIPYCAFQNTAIESIIIPNTITVLEEGAFYQCGKLKHISLPDSVDVIGQAAFADCTSLIEIQMPTNMSSIGESAFSGCTSLIECIIPEGVTSIEEKLFHGCVNLESLSLPSTLISLSGAFYNCGKLTRLNLTDINIWLRLTPSNVSGFLGGQHPFSDSPGGDIYVNGELLTDLVIPNNILKINGYLFQNCTSLRSLTIGSRVTEIGDSAFNGCRNLSSITFSKSTTKYGNYAFYDTGITEITITENMANANTGYGLFASCINLSKVIIQEGVTMIPVAMFGGGESIGCENLTSVTIPTSVKTIGRNAFKLAKRLRTIELHDNVTTIGSGAFKGCISMEEIVLPQNLTVIERDLFDGCTSLKSMIIPNSVTEIQSNAFSRCRSLNSITLSDNLKTIGSSAFAECKSLEYISIPYGVKEIPYMAFQASGLKQIQLPETIETLGYAAISACELTFITLPSSINTIKANVFSINNKLEYVRFIGNTPPSVVDTGFIDYSGTLTSIGHTIIQVPEESLDAYKSTLFQYVDQIVGYTPSEQTNF